MGGGLLLGGVLIALLWSTRYGQALWASTDRFLALEEDNRVFYMPGIEAEAKRVASVLPEAMRRVEALHGGVFTEDLAVYICDTQACFNTHVPRGANARGAVFLKRVFLSPRTFTMDSEVAILTHELDHLYWHQHLGMIAYMANLPVWFQEGMAVFVSGGGGAEQVPEARARQAIRHGQTFMPEGAGSLWVPQTAGRYGLQHHLFYRQSAMFVGYLHDRDPVAFQRFLQALAGGTDFATAIVPLGGSVDELWDMFVQTQ